MLVALTMVLSFGSFAYAEETTTLTPYTGQAYVSTDNPVDYSIESAAQLAELAAKVNAGNTYQNCTFTLIANINLANNSTYQVDENTSLTWTGNTSWTPIGGMCSEDSNYVPNGNSFQGVFNGYYNGTVHKIENMNVSRSATTATKAGYGLFGYVNGGAVGNLILSGSVSVSGSAEYVGSVAGYSSGNVYNCTSSASVTATGSANVGGIVGAAERRSGGAMTVKYCKNTGAVSGSKRVGGIAGGIYSTVGNIVTLDCVANTGTVTANGSQKVYVGGLAGYTRGDILHGYNTGDVDASSTTGRYAGGITGLLNGYSTPYANLRYSFSYASSVAASNDAKALYATADTSTNPVIQNTFWRDINGLTQPTSTNWGTIVDPVVGITDSWFSSSTTPVSDTYNHPLPYYLNNDSADSTYFELASGASYPTLVWESTNGFYVDNLTSANAEGNTQDTDDENMIFVEFSDSTGGTGTKLDPVHNWSDAAGLVNSGRTVIYFMNTMTVNSGTLEITSPTVDGVVVPVTIKRSCTNPDYLFEVTGGTLTLGCITVDGNRGDGSYAYDESTNPTGGHIDVTVKSLVNVNGGNLEINGATLERNYANAGGAVRVYNGTASMSSGTIRYNRTANAGGGVMVTGENAFTSYGTFNITGGIITENQAGTNGGGIAVTTYALVTVGTENATTGPEISNNKGNAYGGGISVAANGIGGSSLNMYSGTVTGNSAIRGSGIATIAEGLNFSRTSKAFLYGGSVKANVQPTNGYLIASNYGGGVYVDGRTQVTLAGATIGGPASEDGNTGAWGGGVYVAGTFTMNSGSIANNKVTGTTSNNNVSFGGLGKGVYVKNGATFTLGSANGIAEDQIVYLANTTNTDCYIRIIASLSNNLTVQCNNPIANTTQIATSLFNSSNYVKYRNNLFNVNSSYDEDEGLYYIKLGGSNS